MTGLGRTYRICGIGRSSRQPGPTLPATGSDFSKAIAFCSGRPRGPCVEVGRRRSRVGWAAHVDRCPRPPYMLYMIRRARRNERATLADRYWEDLLELEPMLGTMTATSVTTTG